MPGTVAGRTEERGLWSLGETARAQALCTALDVLRISAAGSGRGGATSDAFLTRAHWVKHPQALRGSRHATNEGRRRKHLCCFYSYDHTHALSSTAHYGYLLAPTTPR